MPFASGKPSPSIERTCRRPLRALWPGLTTETSVSLHPRTEGAELFVHISAFPRDGSRPAQGVSVTYELGRGADGKPQAIIERTLQWPLHALLPPLM